MVPQHQDAAVVLVEIAIVHGVVHAVVGRRGEGPVEPAQPANLLGVDPVLVEQIDQGDHAKHQRRHARHRYGHVKHPAEQRAAAGLAQRGGQVVVLALVVNHVGSPEQGAGVAQAVVPVVAEIVEHHGEQPAGGRSPEPVFAGPAGPGHGREQGGVNADAQQAGEHGADLAEHAQADAGDGIVDAVGVALTCSPDRIFDGDQHQKNRCGQHDDLARTQHAEDTRFRASVWGEASGFSARRPGHRW